MATPYKTVEKTKNLKLMIKKQYIDTLFLLTIEILA